VLVSRRRQIVDPTPCSAIRAAHRYAGHRRLSLTASISSRRHQTSLAGRGGKQRRHHLPSRLSARSSAALARKPDHRSAGEKAREAEWSSPAFSGSYQMRIIGRRLSDLPLRAARRPDPPLNVDALCERACAPPLLPAAAMRPSNCFTGVHSGLGAPARPGIAAATTPSPLGCLLAAASDNAPNPLTKTNQRQ